MEGYAAGFLVVFGLIFFFLGMGTWIFAGIILVGVSGLFILNDFALFRSGLILQATMWTSSTAWEISAVPLFIWMGDMLLRAEISDRLFRGLVPWVGWLPGRLLHTNVVGCTIFAAVSGSSTATAATIGKITTTALSERGYSKSLSLGSLAGAGSLGILIPPSIPLIIYGVLAQVNIAKLFVAGFLPGLLIAALYSGYIVIVSTLRPSVAPTAERPYSLVERLLALRQIVPVIILIIMVMGGIYTGLATPSEAAAVGVATTFVLVFAMGKLDWPLVRDSLIGSVQTSCMICIMLVAAGFLSAAMGFMHIPLGAAKAIGTMNLSPGELIIVLTVLYILLGCLLDGLSMIVMTLPIVLPMVTEAGFDPIWFGVFLVLVIEMAMVTPPVGFNLFVIQGLTGDPIGRIAVASIPFFLLLCVGVALVTIYPDIALWLPAALLD